MKFIIKLLLKAGVTLGVLFVAYQYLMPGMMGDFSIDFTQKASKGLENLSEVVVEKDVTVYKWTDKDGVTHFGGTAPTGQGDYEKKEISANANVVQRLKTPEEEAKEEQTSQVTQLGSPYSADAVKDLMDDAKKIKKDMEERQSATDEILNNL